jgi:cytochrome c peroxidase
MSEAKVSLGRALFYDTRLSGNHTYSCASCHAQAHAFTDGRAAAIGSTGQAHARSTMSLANVAYNASYGWADEGTRTLEGQMAVPMFNEHPIELGLKGREAEIESRFRGDAARFREAFPGDADPVRLANIVKAIASFERTIVSAGSPLDRYLYRDDRTAMSPAALRGMKLYFSDRLACGFCHGGFNLSGPTDHEGNEPVTPTFHNTALYNVDGRGAYPATDRGLFDKTGKPADMGSFRAPTLRNIAVTAPYMHDGSIATLDAAISHYAARGVASPLRSPRLKGFTLSAAEKADLLAFLNALTDEEFLRNSAYRPLPATAARLLTGVKEGGRN